MESNKRTMTSGQNAQNTQSNTVNSAVSSVNAGNLRDHLKNKRFWFARKKILNRGFFDHWPMGDGQFVENLTNVIGTDFYGKQFDDAKKTYKFNNIANPEAQAIANTSTGDMREAYSLINNGFTSRSILGKLRDIEINESVAKNRLETISGARHPAPDVDNWAIIGLNEEKITPREYFNLLKAELIVENPIIEEHRLRKQRDATFNPLLNEDSYAPPVIMDGVSINSFQNMETIENFDKVMGTISRKARVNLVSSDAVEAGNVEITKRKYYGPLRSIRNIFRGHTNSRTTGLPGAYTVKFSAQNSQSEQLYMVLKSMAEASVRPYMEETSRLISTTSAENLPNINTFNENSHAISRASACLIASDMCKMLDLEPHDAKVMSTFFKVEAAQHLNSITDSQNENIMPLIADYYAESINNFAQDFGISLDTFAQYEQFDTTTAVNLGSALYSRRATPTTNTLGESNFNFARNNQNTEALDYIFGYLNRRAISQTPSTPTPLPPAPAPTPKPTPAPTPLPPAPAQEKSFSRQTYGNDVLKKHNYEDGSITYDINDIECSKEDFEEFEDLSKLIYSPTAKMAKPNESETMRQLVRESEYNNTEYFYIKGVPATRRAFYSQKDLVVFNGICATNSEFELYKSYTRNQIVLDVDYNIENDGVIITPYNPEPKPEPKPLPGGNEVKPLPSPEPEPAVEAKNEDYQQISDDLISMALGITPNRIESQSSVRMNKKHIIERKLEEIAQRKAEEESVSEPDELPNPNKKKRELIETELEKRPVSIKVQGLPGNYPNDAEEELLDPVIDLDEYDPDKPYFRHDQKGSKYAQAIMRKYERQKAENRHAEDDFGDLLPKQPDQVTPKAEQPKEEKTEVKKDSILKSLDDFLEVEENIDNNASITEENIDNNASDTAEVTKKKPSHKKQEFYGPRIMGHIPTEIEAEKVKCTSTQVEKSCVKVVADIVKDKFTKQYAEGMLYNKAAAASAENSREYFDNLDKAVDCHNESELYAVVGELLDDHIDHKSRKRKDDRNLLDDSHYQAEKDVCKELLEVADSLVKEVVHFREKNYSVTGPKMTNATFEEYVNSVGGMKNLKAKLDERFVTPILNRGFFQIRGIEDDRQKSFE